jgi:hypothetical protein
MDTLNQLAIATGATAQTLPSGRVAQIQTLTVRFPPANPPRLPDGALSRTYTSKPLVSFDGEGVFGEIAIVRSLRKDGWSAVWADTFHGGKFWADMPTRSSPVGLSARVQNLYDRIINLKGTPNGCFDVVAWKDGRVVWLEYKGPRDRPNRNEEIWVDAACSSGVREQDLFFVGAAARR